MEMRIKSMKWQEFGTKNLFLLLLTYTVGPPKISLEPKYREVQKIKGGTRMKLQATVTGNPKPSVTWLLNDVTLTSSGPINIRTDDAGLSTIEVDDSSRLTAGKYRVAAENNLGRASTDIEVTVTGRSLLLADRMLIHIYCFSLFRLLQKLFRT